MNKKSLKSFGLAVLFLLLIVGTNLVSCKIIDTYINYKISSHFKDNATK